jgi:ankyrin repeat protein
MNGHVSAVLVLLTEGEIKMDVDVRDADSFTPLQWAARSGCVEVLTKLTQHGADINAVNRDGAFVGPQQMLMIDKNASPVVHLGKCG